MHRNNRELIFQLLEDVALLHEALTERQLPTPQTARALIAPILRRWICEQLFHKVQSRLRPHIVRFGLFEMPNTIAHCEDGDVEHWMTMIDLNGFAFSAVLPNPSLIREDGSSPLSRRLDSTERTLRPSKMFFEQRMFFWKRNFYKRRDILSIHANQLGGVHLDFRRREDQTHIEELAQYLGFEISGLNYQMLAGEALWTAKADLGRRGRTYDVFELVAIDTARIFVAGVQSSRAIIESLLHSPE